IHPPHPSPSSPPPFLSHETLLAAATYGGRSRPNSAAAGSAQHTHVIPSARSSISSGQIRWARPPATMHKTLHPLGFGPPCRRSVVASTGRHVRDGCFLPYLDDGAARSGCVRRRLVIRDGLAYHPEAIARRVREE
uniref:Uncharacterized protein n=1 Tax=Triticum urartu TaxID=4572 RepID=A0A8R7P4Q4_TRIUA